MKGAEGDEVELGVGRDEQLAGVAIEAVHYRLHDQVVQGLGFDFDAFQLAC